MQPTWRCTAWHRACGQKEGLGRLIACTKDGMDTELHAVADASGRSPSFFMTTGQVSDDADAATLLDHLPKTQWLLSDRSYDAD